MKKTFEQKTFVLAAIAIVVVITGLIIFAAISRNPDTSVSKSPANSTSPSPSPGRPGNPGDESKSVISTHSPSPVATPGDSARFTLFTASSQDGGKLRISNQLSGLSAGDCKLHLSAPSGGTKDYDGQAISSGTYYFCSFGSITGVNEIGKWSAKLTASNSGASATAETNFEVK